MNLIKSSRVTRNKPAKIDKESHKRRKVEEKKTEEAKDEVMKAESEEEEILPLKRRSSSK